MRERRGAPGRGGRPGVGDAEAGKGPGLGARFVRRFPRLGFAVGLFLLILAFLLVLALLLIFPAGLFFRGQPPLPDVEFLPVFGLVVGGALLAAAAMWLYDRLYLSDGDREETRYDRALNRVMVWLGTPLIACFIVFDVLYPFFVLGLALL